LRAFAVFSFDLPGDAGHRFFYVLARIEGAQSNIPLTRCAEPAARRAHDVLLLQNGVGEIPTRGVIRCLYPRIWPIDTAVDPHPDGAELLADDAGVVHVVLDELADLLHA